MQAASVERFRIAEISFVAANIRSASAIRAFGRPTTPNWRGSAENPDRVKRGHWTVIKLLRRRFNGPIVASPGQAARSDFV